ncbi:MAG TPA: ABC transporter ATP-binding protein, partial [Kofleriaceae bacterium]|nr:ABC transporter ATP-binding protein [Kofleriaceae bacterium]
KGIGRKATREELWALRDITFDVEQGQVVGVIGRNGAGKSTLLKILTRITFPTVGTAELRGRVGSLLEVGTGFHPELTGRENVFLNGSILGMRNDEIRRKFDEIVAFAEVAKFIDTPVKHYSSGMGVRLAFAVAAHLESEILLVDEVLAVGDVAFQQKCLGKMSDVTKSGRTVLFVSHQLAAVSQLCSKVILFERGALAYYGASQEGIVRYLSSGSRSGDLTDTERSGTSPGLIRAIRVLGADGRPRETIGSGEPFRIELEIDRDDRKRRLVAGVDVRTQQGLSLAAFRSDAMGVSFGPYEDAGRMRLEVAVPGLAIYPGSYVLEPWVAEYWGQRLDQVHDACQLNIEAMGRHKSESLLQPGRAILVVDSEWRELPGADA